MHYEIISNIASLKKQTKMKKSVIILSMLFIAITGSAQKNELINAAIEMKGIDPLRLAMSIAQKADGVDDMKKKVVKAKEQIDLCQSKQKESGALTKAKDLGKMHYYTGLVYMSYPMFAEGDEAIKKDVEANEEAYAKLGPESFKASLAASNYYEEEITGMMGQMRAMAINGGVQLFQDKDFENAYLAFTSSVEAYDVLGKQDTVAMYYAGLSADNLDAYDNALEYYGMAAALKYGGDSRTHQLMVKVATRKNEGNPSEETFKIIQEGRALYAGDLNLILEEFNYYYKTGDAVAAQNSLQEAVKADPENPILHFNIGATFDEMSTAAHKEGSHEDAAQFVSKSADAYKKAIALDASYMDAYFNLGALYYNEAAELNNIANKIEDAALYEAEKAKADEMFKAAVPQLVKAHELAPEDITTLKILKNIYIQIDDTAKFTEANDKLKALGQ